MSGLFGSIVPAYGLCRVTSRFPQLPAPAARLFVVELCRLTPDLVAPCGLSLGLFALAPCTPPRPETRQLHPQPARESARPVILRAEHGQPDEDDQPAGAG